MLIVSVWDIFDENFIFCSKSAYVLDDSKNKKRNFGKKIKIKIFLEQLKKIALGGRGFRFQTTDALGLKLESNGSHG